MERKSYKINNGGPATLKIMAPILGISQLKIQSMYSSIPTERNVVTTCGWYLSVVTTCSWYLANMIVATFVLLSGSYWSNYAYKGDRRSIMKDDWKECHFQR